jgi:cytoplasmic tRNA 2-thiolation protein 1
VLRGDLARLSRTTSIITSTPSISPTPTALSQIKRSKPLKYAYEKEIVLYAHHKSLDYFSTECIYSPEAFRGSARALIKNLERTRPSAILDIVRSGEDMARLCPGYEESCRDGCESKPAAQSLEAEEEGEGGCGSSIGRTAVGEMSRMEELLAQKEMASQQQLDVEVEVRSISNFSDSTTTNQSLPLRKKKTPALQKVGTCEKCGYMSSQKICKACVLLEGLNKSRPKAAIGIQEVLT